MTRRTRVSATAAAASLLFAVTTSAAENPRALREPLPTNPGAFSLKFEPGVSFPLTVPQTDRFTTGGGLTLKGLWALNRYLDLGPSVSFTELPAKDTAAPGGTAWTFGASLRLKRPHDVSNDAAFFGISPWVDGDALFVQSGPLSRPGVAAAVGLAIPLGDARVFWLGPFVRYFQIVHFDRAGLDTNDARMISVGLSLEVGSGIEREREPEHEPVAPVMPAPPQPIIQERIVTKEVIKEVISCPDRDNDTIPDAIDHCPDISGPMDFFGCPPYKKLVVQKDKLELKDKLYFAFDKATLLPRSFPVLDEVAQALKDNKTFKVSIEGYTSSEGGASHNQLLSEQRASAVLDYLAAHGVAKDRLSFRGMASSAPADSNVTNAGRENNRRVEFVVSFIINNNNGAQ